MPAPQSVPTPSPAATAHATSTASQRQPYGPKLVCAHEAEPQHDERERGAVVQAGFSGQAEPDRFGIMLVLDLHVRRKDRIGRREQRAEQHRRAQGQTERRPPRARRPLRW